MKKLIYILIFALCLSGCSQGIGTQSGDVDIPKSASQSQPLTESVKSPLIKASLGTREGRYAIGRPNDMQILTYVDYAMATEVALCNQPSCPHNADGCAALIHEGESVNELYTFDGKMLAMIVNGRHMVDPPRIYIMDKDGSNRKEIYVGKTNQLIRGILAIDDENIYFQSNTNEDDATKLQVYALPLTGGEARLVHETDYIAAIFLGVNGRELYYYAFDWSEQDKVALPTLPEGATVEEHRKILDEYNSKVIGKFWAYAANVDTGESKKIMEWTSQMGGEGSKQLLMRDNILYYTDGKVYGQINPDYSQEQLPINWETPLGEKEYVTVNEAIIDDKAIVVSYNNLTDKVTRHAIDLQTGNTWAIDLSYITNASLQPIKIVGISLDSVLVHYDNRLKNEMRILPDGTASDDNKVANSYAMITYDDFFASKPNYKEVSTQFIENIINY